MVQVAFIVCAQVDSETNYIEMSPVKLGLDHHYLPDQSTIAGQTKKAYQTSRKHNTIQK